LTASVASFLSKAQRKGTELPPAVSGALLLAAVRSPTRKGRRSAPTSSGRRRRRNRSPHRRAAHRGWLRRSGASQRRRAARRSRVLVYAAERSHELVTLTPPQAGLGVGLEVHGPLAKVIRKAMAERQKRFKNLTEMARASRPSTGARPRRRSS